MIYVSPPKWPITQMAIAWRLEPPQKVPSKLSQMCGKMDILHSMPTGPPKCVASPQKWYHNIA